MRANLQPSKISCPKFNPRGHVFISLAMNNSSSFHTDHEVHLALRNPNCILKTFSHASTLPKSTLIRTVCGKERKEILKETKSQKNVYTMDEITQNFQISPCYSTFWHSLEGWKHKTPDKIKKRSSSSRFSDFSKKTADVRILHSHSKFLYKNTLVYRFGSFGFASLPLAFEYSLRRGLIYLPYRMYYVCLMYSLSGRSAGFLFPSWVILFLNCFLMWGRWKGKCCKSKTGKSIACDRFYEAHLVTRLPVFPACQSCVWNSN